jgi:hypothetical protein
MIRSYVVEGATLKCSCGSQTSKLKLPRNSKITINQIKQATVADYHANVNILPFGQCNSIKNPQVKKATEANHGRLTPQPCQPVILSPWNNEKGNVINDDDANLLNTSTLRCKWHKENEKIEISDDGQQCVLRAAPPPVRYEKDPYALPEDKGNIMVDGEKYSIYVPEYQGRTNANYKKDGWRTIKTKHVTATNTDWLGVIANYNCDEMTDSSNMSNTNIRDYCYLTLILGFLQAHNNNTVKTHIHVEIQKKGTKHRAVVQYGRTNTALQSKAGLPYYYSDLKSTVEANGSVHGKTETQEIIKKYYQRKDNKTYDIKIYLDSNHTNNPYIGYLSIVCGNVMISPKLYKNDDAELGHFSGLFGFIWEINLNLRYQMARSTKIPEVDISKINKIVAPDIKFIS